MRKILLLLGLFPAATGFAQKKANPQKFAATITEEDLRTHLFILAGPEMEGRETATEGQRKAAAYIEDQFKKLGLLPGNQGAYQMSFPVYRDSILGGTIKVNETSFSINKDFLPNARMTRNGDYYFSEFVFAGHGIVDGNRDDYNGLNVKGKAVVILDDKPADYTTQQKGAMAPSGLYGKYQKAVEKGAAALLVVSGGFPRTNVPALGNMYVNLYSAEQNAALYSISAAVAEKLIGSDWAAIASKATSTASPAKLYKANLLLQLNKQVQALESTNVLGYVEGSDKKDEWLVVTAHYDHLGKRGNVIYYGADDDGSGTVGVIEMAEAFAKAKAAGNGPRRNILFMAVSGEEKGLWGSAWYGDNPAVPLEKTTANLNIDMIGRVDTERKSADTLSYVYVVGDDKLSTELKPLSEAANKKYTKLTLDYKFNDPNDQNRIYFRSDHYNFARKGVPVIFYYDGMLKADYHMPTDTPDKINYSLLKKRAQLVFYTAWEMANREQMMKRDLEIPTMTR